MKWNQSWIRPKAYFLSEGLDYLNPKPRKIDAFGQDIFFYQTLYPHTISITHSIKNVMELFT